MRQLWTLGRVFALTAFLTGVATPASALVIYANHPTQQQIDLSFGGVDFDPVDAPLGIAFDVTISGLDPGESIGIGAARVVGGINVDLGGAWEIIGGILFPNSLFLGYHFPQAPPRLYIHPGAIVAAYNAADGFSLIFDLLGPPGSAATVESVILSGFNGQRQPIRFTAYTNPQAPEPASLTLIGLGAAAGIVRRRRTGR